MTTSIKTALVSGLFLLLSLCLVGKGGCSSLDRECPNFHQQVSQPADVDVEAIEDTYGYGADGE